MSNVVHVDTAALLRVGGELENIMGNLASTAEIVADELVAPIAKKSGSERIEAVGQDWTQIATDAKAQQQAAIAANANVTDYANKLATISSNE